VGYFDPDLDADDDMVTIGKDLWFRDVFLSTERLKDITITKVAFTVCGLCRLLISELRNYKYCYGGPETCPPADKRSL
jgi:hypothetical protein